MEEIQMLTCMSQPSTTFITRAMAYMLMMVEPVGQRQSRTEAEGREAYARMVRWGESLQERGLLIAAESLRCSALSKAAVLRIFTERSTYARGKQVEVDGRIRGITAGLDEEGFLLVDTPTGTERILAGGVRPV